MTSEVRSTWHILSGPWFGTQPPCCEEAQTSWSSSHEEELWRGTQDHPQAWWFTLRSHKTQHMVVPPAKIYYYMQGYNAKSQREKVQSQERQAWVSGVLTLGSHTGCTEFLLQHVCDHACEMTSAKKGLWSSLAAQTVKKLPAMCKPGFNPWVGMILWEREWLPTPIFLPGESHGQRSLVGPWGYKELDITEWLTFIVVVKKG